MQDDRQPVPASDEETVEPAHRVHLPGFIVEHEIGLGDVIKRATASMGIKPCGGCQQRAAAMNRWLTFTNRGARG